MALVTMQDVLKVAEEKKIAIAAFTVDTLEVAEEIASVAEEKQLPAIMMVGQNTFKYNKLEKIASICRQIANSTNAQLVLHLDHGASYEQVIQCLRNGFTSVMIDGSRLPLKENIRVTKEVTRAAHTVGVSVEAELGLEAVHVVLPCNVLNRKPSVLYHRSSAYRRHRSDLSVQQFYR